jgi:hypothetical protein
MLLLVFVRSLLRHHSPIDAELAVYGLLVAVFLGQGFGQQPLASVDPLPRTLQMVLVSHGLDRPIPLLTLHPIVCAIVSNFEDFVSQYLIAKVSRACVLVRAAFVIVYPRPAISARPIPPPRFETVSCRFACLVAEPANRGGWGRSTAKCADQ